MELKDVRTKEDLEKYYEEHHLYTYWQKIGDLREEMGVIFATHEADTTAAEELSCLEQMCLECWDRVSCKMKGERTLQSIAQQTMNELAQMTVDEFKLSEEDRDNNLFESQYEGRLRQNARIRTCQ